MFIVISYLKAQYENDKKITAGTIKNRLEKLSVGILTSEKTEFCN
jgi:hypothetical protein